MTKVKIFFISVMLLIAASLSAQSESNIAYQDNQVRFTVITDGVIRLEWQPEGKFNDLASFVASERDYPSVDYKIRRIGKKVRIETKRMTLEYKTGSGKFDASNLTIKANDGFFTWKPGMEQKENLKGTFRTLDGLDGDLQTQTWVADIKKGEIRQFEDGILARDGWTLIDESESYLFDDSDWAWVKEREAKECQDWYFMAYGQDYKAALKDFTVFAGKMPLPPRFTFGYWWSRYWAYSDREMRTLVDKFHAYDIPLDVLVVDMDWHYTDPGRGGWTGWTWNKSIFPDPKKFMDYLKDEGLKVTLNLHPADGFDHWEECYPALAKSLGKDPSSKERIEWINSDKEFMSNMFEQVMHPMQKEGVDSGGSTGSSTYSTQSLTSSTTPGGSTTPTLQIWSVTVTSVLCFTIVGEVLETIAIRSASQEMRPLPGNRLNSSHISLPLHQMYSTDIGATTSEATSEIQ